MKVERSVCVVFAQALLILFLGVSHVYSSDNFSLNREQKREIQTILNELGYDVGLVDGAIGPKTTTKLKKFCADNQIEYPESLDIKFLIELQDEVKDHFPLKTMMKSTNFKVEKPNSLLFDTTKYNYPNCQYFLDVNDHKYARGFEQFWNDFEKLAVADILVGAPELGTEGESSTIDAFAIRLYKETASCIASGQVYEASFDVNACGAILEIVKRFKDRAALTKTSPHRSKLQYFKSIEAVLIPITLSYSAAVQRLGEPEDHDEILLWLYAAITQNTYDVFTPDKPIRDLNYVETTCNAQMHFSAANNHSLQSGYLIGLYGALSENEKLFNFAFDRAAVTLSSIDKKGALTCEASRGSNATYYSGATISALLQIFELAKLNGQDFSSIPYFENIHKAAKFLLDAGEDPSVIYPYAKANIIAWCDKDYRKQCAGYVGFGWIRHYMKLFPTHPNVQRIKNLALEMNESETMATERQKNLSAIVKQNFPNRYIRKNIFHSDKWSKNDINLLIYDDSGGWHRGSPLCLYEREIADLSGKVNSAKIKPKVSHVDPSEKLDLWSSISTDESAD